MFFCRHRSAERPVPFCREGERDMTLKAWIMIALAAAIVAGNIILIVRGRKKR